jgi:hypothetical protein
MSTISKNLSHEGSKKKKKKKISVLGNVQNFAKIDHFLERIYGFRFNLLRMSLFWSNINVN